MCIIGDSWGGSDSGGEGAWLNIECGGTAGVGEGGKRLTSASWTALRAH